MMCMLPYTPVQTLNLRHKKTTQMSGFMNCETLVHECEIKSYGL